MISTMVANLPVFLTRTTRPTSTNLQLEVLTIESVDIFGLLILLEGVSICREQVLHPEISIQKTAYNDQDIENNIQMYQ